jgi:hypothetical protein
MTTTIRFHYEKAPISPIAANKVPMKTKRMTSQNLLGINMAGGFTIEVKETENNPPK